MTRSNESSDQIKDTNIEPCLFCEKQPIIDMGGNGQLVFLIHECSMVKYRVSPLRPHINTAIASWNRTINNVKQRIRVG